MKSVTVPLHSQHLSKRRCVLCAVNHMSHLDALARRFKEKDIEKLQAICQEESKEDGIPRMSPAAIKLTCLQNDGCYESPELNDKLYLHFRAYRKIENLAPYVNVKTVWLDSNGITTIEGLECLQQLRTLFLSKNLISSIQGLSSLSYLSLIDLSDNRLGTLEGLADCQSLETLNISRNALTTAESIQTLTKCMRLQTLDMTHNLLEEKEDILQVFQNIPALVTLSVTGNEVCKLPSFRKRLIATVPKLGFLDRPIEELERVGANAFATGGYKAEQEARDAYKARVSQK